MGNFSSGERRGTIFLTALIALIICAVAYFGRGYHRPMPVMQPAPVAVPIAAPAADTAETDSTVADSTVADSTHKRSKRKKASATKQKPQREGRRRSMLDEPVPPASPDR